MRNDEGGVTNERGGEQGREDVERRRDRHSVAVYRDRGQRKKKELGEERGTEDRGKERNWVRKEGLKTEEKKRTGREKRG
ncbi:MAG: hypothetical protein I3J02_06075 [Prevotella sp.]|nr:hypothetical protein [Prevotella sp.]